MDVDVYVLYAYTLHRQTYSKACEDGSEMSKLLQTYSDSRPRRHYLLLAPQDKFIRHLHFSIGLRVSQTLQCCKVKSYHSRVLGLSSIPACLLQQDLQKDPQRHLYSRLPQCLHNGK